MLEDYHQEIKKSRWGAVVKQIPERGVERSHKDPPRQKQGQRPWVGTSLLCWHNSQENTEAGRHTLWEDPGIRTGSHHGLNQGSWINE